MLSFATRTISLAALLVAVCAFGARPAHAGGIFWGEPVCESPSDVSTLFDSVAFSYAGSLKCEAMCKTALSSCKAFVKNAASCQASDNGGYWKMFKLAACAGLSGSDKKDCLSFAKDGKSSNKQFIADDKATGLANCGAFYDACVADCAMVL